MPFPAYLLLLLLPFRTSRTTSLTCTHANIPPRQYLASRALASTSCHISPRTPRHATSSRHISTLRFTASPRHVTFITFSRCPRVVLHPHAVLSCRAPVPHFAAPPRHIKTSHRHFATPPQRTTLHILTPHITFDSPYPHPASYLMPLPHRIPAPRQPFSTTWKTRKIHKKFVQKTIDISVFLDYYRSSF